MLMIAMYCLLGATGLLTLGICFSKQNNPLSLLLKIFALIALVCLGTIGANYKNSFNGYTLLILLSILPMFITTFDLRSHLAQKKNILEQQIHLDAEETKSTEEIANPNQNQKSKKTKKYHFINCEGYLINGLGILLASVPLAISAFYKGLEIYYGLLIGLAFGFAMTFLYLIFKKNPNPFDIFGCLMIYIAAGLCFGQTAIVWMFSMELKNIVFGASLCVFGIYAIVNTITRKNFVYLLYVASILGLFSTIIIL